MYVGSGSSNSRMLGAGTKAETRSEWNSCVPLAFGRMTMGSKQRG